MRVRPSLAATAIAFAVALLVAPASAQGGIVEGMVTTVIEPDEATIDTRKHVRDANGDYEGQYVDLHVDARIECLAGLAKPIDVTLNATKAFVKGTNAHGEDVTYIEFIPGGLVLEWKAGGTDGVWIIDETIEIELFTDSVAITSFDHDNEYTQSTDGELPFGGQPVTRCSPSGYAWNVDAAGIVVHVPGTDVGLPRGGDEDGEPDEDQPVPAGPLALIAVAAAALGRRRVV